MIGRRIMTRSIAGLRAILMVLAAAWLPGTAWAIANGITVSQATYLSTFPWAAALYDPVGGGVCSGELISPTYVLTAAHCAGSPTVLIGAADRTTVTPIVVSNAIIHPSYDSVNHYYDVALMHLATPVYNTKPVKLTTLSQANYYLKPNRAATVAGWGHTTANNSSFSNILMQHGTVMAGLNLQSTLVIYQDLTTGPCAGDSGGPLIVQVSGGVGPVLMGTATVSDGDLCAATSDGIAGYTNIGQMLGFINTTNVPDLGQILPPAAKPDQATMTQERPVQIAVATNDMGFGSTLTVAVVTPPAHGIAAVSGSPGTASAIFVTYTPAAGYSGTDSFVYSITDGTSSDSATVTLTVLPDADLDGVPDSQDNCIYVYNPSQLDADGDGYGNICDADLNNSGKVTSEDYILMRSVLNQSASSSPRAAAADLDGSGMVTAADFSILRGLFNTAPGPSGLHP